jgi:hypothetical protein
MARPKPINYDPPLDLNKLPQARPTKGDKIKALDEMIHRASIAWRERHARILTAIRFDILASGQARKNSAPAETRAPSRTEDRTEQGSSIAESVLGRKIELEHGGSLSLKPETRVLALNVHVDNHDNPFFACALSPDNARQLAALLIETADDVDRDTAVREHYAKLVSTTG